MADLSPTLSRIAKGDLCSGCGLCCAVVSKGRIKMTGSETGYLRPEQTDVLTPEEDARIAQTCPGLGIVREPNPAIDHTIWGPVAAIRVGRSTDANLRRQASSGGVLSALLLYLLESKSIDYVLHTAASRDFPIANEIRQSIDRNDIFAAAGSRYAPSAPLSDFNQQLARPGRFAFLGKPCDVAAIRAFARLDSRVEEKVPFVLSFFCAGIPSLKGARQILKKLNVREEEVVSFRYRGNGWPGFAAARLKDGREARMSYADSWGGILSKHVQFRCKICPDGTGELADLVCGDAWYCDDKGYPLFEEEDGRSLIMSRTNKGEELLQNAAKAGYISMAPIDIDEVAKMQPSQARRKTLVFYRLLALPLLWQVLPRFRGLRLTAAARAADPWEAIRNFLGMARRLLLRSIRSRTT